MAPHVVCPVLRVFHFALDPPPVGKLHFEQPDVVEDVGGAAAATHHQQIVLVEVKLGLAVAWLGTGLGDVLLGPFTGCNQTRKLYLSKYFKTGSTG